MEEQSKAIEKRDIYWGSVAAGFFFGWFGYFALLLFPGDNAGRAKSVTIGWVVWPVLLIGGCGCAAVLRGIAAVG